MYKGAFTRHALAFTRGTVLKNRAKGPWPGTEITRPAPRTSIRSHEKTGIPIFFSVLRFSHVSDQSSPIFEGQDLVTNNCGRERKLLRTATRCSTCARFGAKLGLWFIERFPLWTHDQGQTRATSWLKHVVWTRLMVTSQSH